MTSSYSGIIEIQNVTVELIAKLNKYLGEDVREMGFKNEDFVHLDLKLTEELHGLEWNGMEKTYAVPSMLNFLMKQTGCVLEGEMTADYQDYGEKARILIGEDGLFYEQAIPDGDKYAVWSNEHKSWWRANECGYTRNLEEAGSYTAAQALKICEGANLCVTMGENPNEIPVPMDLASCLQPGVPKS